MKAKLLLLLVVALCIFFTGKAQIQPSHDHYYVTVGVFAVHENAVNFTNKINKKNFNCHYAIRLDRKLYYVYLLDTEDRRKAFAYTIRTRVETEFKDAWVYIGNLGELKTHGEIAKTEIKPEAIRPEVIKELPVQPQQYDEMRKDTVVVSAKIQKDSVSYKKPTGKPFFFKAIDRETGEYVNGEVQILTSPDARQYQAFPVNELVYVKASPSTPAIGVTVAAAGYQEMSRAIDYKDPKASSDEIGLQDEAIISFPMKRVKRGDYIEFTNVRFYQNSAILRPESRDELDGLADMMKEFPRYKIKVHGHCNGMESRDIVSKGSSANFFVTDGSNLKKIGTPKQLSEFRAEIIKEYLVSQGIDADRIATKGDGSKQMIFPENSTQASRNDRVEVEVSKSRRGIFQSLNASSSDKNVAKETMLIIEDKLTVNNK